MATLQSNGAEPSVEIVSRGHASTLLFQIKLLVWKRYLESTKSKWDLIKVVLPAVLFFALMLLLYSVFGFIAAGGLEEFIVPLAFWIYIQRIVVQIMFEKSSRLQESMRMMGLSDFAYWVSYFISEGVIVGFLLSFVLAIISTGGLFNDGNFGVVLGYLFVFCLSVVPFCFFICAFFDTPQTSGQATLGLLFGVYITHIVVFLIELASIPVLDAQIICCFVPPIALQLGARSFLKSYDGLPLSDICGIMVADIFIYSILAWYFSQVWPSKVGVPKPWYFPFLYSYWCKSTERSHPQEIQPLPVSVEEGAAHGATIPTEEVNETLIGAPAVTAHKLRKSYGTHVVIDDLSFNMYENQIFALLGHNGAGKTTVISMLTGLINPDATYGNNGATVYGHDILTDMDGVRQSMGVCPQHDVLFESLSVREHILFFAQLKSATYESAEAETNHLMSLFHLESKQHNLGSELSGGQRRKLSVAIAVCGGSKFVVLDEPTAGMDPLARRELWDLLAALRKGRTMLLTTHYMDEADILGDRVGIMSLGQMQCMGSTKFLKNTYGAGYKLIFDKVPDMTQDQLAALTTFVQASIPEAKYFETDGAEEQARYALPFSTVSKFGPLFTQLDDSLAHLHVSAYHVTITSLEDVFLKVGEDHTVTPHAAKAPGIGARKYESNFFSQTIGIAWRKLTYSFNDFITIPLLLLPIAVAIAAAIIYNLRVIADSFLINDLVISAMYLAGYLGAPGLIAEFIVKERNDKLRNVLTVMGCDFRAYWIGTFIADYIILAIPMVVMWITWFAAGMSDFYAGSGGLNFFIMLLFNFHLVAFSYFFSFIFTDPKSCISLMPIVILMLIISPNIILLIVINICMAAGITISVAVQGGILLWGTMILTPHGALLTAFLNTTQNFSSLISSFPHVGVVIAFMVVESALFLWYAYYTDAQSVAALPVREDPHFNTALLKNLDEDVAAERERTLSTIGGSEPLRIERLRKVFPPKRVGQKSVIANQDVTFKVESGEIFGLLGANGAGKTVTLSMLTRHLTPTAGDAFIAKHSILSDFSKGATHLGVVTQNNSLWDRLSVEDHLYLFARLRGVPEDVVKEVVDGTIDQLELTPHRHKLAMRLSGGMKRKLCVAIALIGDPEVVLLDEPSAGLDPVSRRNLWSVILRTMSHRAVILTTHSMDEAEALCKRIGIMVQGQLRALGTKQHLKIKFGSGFELVVKVHVTDFEKQVAALDTFVRGMFPSAQQISENGGLITYTIPREEMKMGLAFTQLELHKTELSIEDYSVAQPTLEQVFIRMVNKHTPGGDKKIKNAGSATVIGGSALMSVEGTQGFKQNEAPEEDPNQEHIFGEVIEELNRCGCTSRTACYIMLGLTLLLACVFGASIGVSVARSPAAGALWIITIIVLICTLIACCVRFCTVCQAPKGADE